MTCLGALRYYDLGDTFPLLPQVLAHPSGAVLLPRLHTAVIADAHLGYGWAQRRRGELGPLADEQTKAKLLALTDEWKPQRIVFLGDVVHAPKPCIEERLWIEDLLLDLSTKAQLIAVRGNHDRAFAREFAHLPVETTDAWEWGDVYALHGDRLPRSRHDDQLLMLGHLHPALPVHDAAGAGRKLPVFLVNARCLLLPAFSPFAGGYDLLAGLSEEWASLFGGDPIQVYATTGTRVAVLGELTHVAERIIEAERGTPAQFRRRTARGQSTKSGR